MTASAGASAARPRIARVGALGSAIWCSLVLAAWSQTIKIPDFRQQPPPVATFKPGEACIDCGRIVSIREVQTERRPNPPAAFQGPPGPATGPAGTNLVGAVIYLPLGGESTERPFVGGVGTPEMRERFRETTYEIAVRLDNGSLRVARRHDGTRFRVGDKVRMAGGDQLELVAE